MSNLYIVGIGPGKRAGMTMQAYQVLEECPCIVGYTAYIDLVRGLWPDKQYLSTPMTKETDRCRMALELAEEGKNTAVVCSGDPGVYGMAGLVYQLAASGAYPDVKIRIIPGVTSALSGAALVGAPLTHDFCVISLSDRLTPVELIRERLELAAKGDFVICLYNPASRGRKDYLKKACELLMNYKSGDTVSAWARKIGRKGEEFGVTTLKKLAEFPADMFTTCWIGNSHSENIGGYMVTPRGYHDL